MIAAILAVQTLTIVAIVAFVITGELRGRCMARSLVATIEARANSLANAHTGIQRSLAEIDARLGALEARDNGKDPHGYLLPGGLSRNVEN
jgi:hypothetical protein